MAQQYSNAMAPSESAPVISSEQSKALIPTSAALVDNANAAHAQQSLALIPTSTSTALTGPSASAGISTAGPPQTSTPHNFLQEGEEAWSAVTRSLMVAVMVSQPPATAASTLLGVFRPIVDGWAAARKEGKRWKERAEVYMAEHHKHKIELAQKHDSLQAQVESLKRSLEESQGRARELESQESTILAKVASLEKKHGEAEAQARAAKEAYAQQVQQSKKEVEAMTKSAEDAKSMCEKLREEIDKKARSHAADIAKLQDKIKELEAIKGKLEERHASAIARTTSLEGELSQKGQEIANLQSRISELTTRKEALERQLALYQRIPTRRF